MIGASDSAWSSALPRRALRPVGAIFRRRNIAAETAELLTARPRGGERDLKSSSVGLCDNRHDTHNHFVRLRHVGGE
jgi:hypothetical protein